MKQFFISRILVCFRGRIAAKINRAILLLIFLALAHVPYLAHLCDLFHLSPDILAGGIWALLLEGLHWLRDKYPQSSDYLTPLIQGEEEAGKPVANSTVVKVEPVRVNPLEPWPDPPESKGSCLPPCSQVPPPKSWPRQ